jgi:Na+/melibiose symporter-like transporter
MVADVADADELRTGLRREGIYFGISNFGLKRALRPLPLTSVFCMAPFRRC